MYCIEDLEITSLSKVYFFGVLRHWSKPAQYKIASEVKEQLFRSVIRAVREGRSQVSRVGRGSLS